MSAKKNPQQNMMEGLNNMMKRFGINEISFGSHSIVKTKSKYPKQKTNKTKQNEQK